MWVWDLWESYSPGSDPLWRFHRLRYLVKLPQGLRSTEEESVHTVYWISYYFHFLCFNIRGCPWIRCICALIVSHELAISMSRMSPSSVYVRCPHESHKSVSQGGSTIKCICVLVLVSPPPLSSPHPPEPPPSTCCSKFVLHIRFYNKLWLTNWRPIHLQMKKYCKVHFLKIPNSH
jgi:hypothetical protein